MPHHEESAQTSAWASAKQMVWSRLPAFFGAGAATTAASTAANVKASAATRHDARRKTAALSADSCYIYSFGSLNMP